MIELVIDSGPAELRDARRAVGAALVEDGLDAVHAQDVAAVVDELIGAARECHVVTPLILTVTAYAKLTSVRLRCDRHVELRDTPFEVRERLLHGLTLAFGRRGRPDGSVDLWAEVPRLSRADTDCCRGGMDR